MKKIQSFILMLGLLSATSFSGASLAAEKRIFGFGVSFDQHQYSQGMTLEILSPSFYNAEDGETSSFLSAFLSASSLEMRNIHADATGKYDKIENELYLLGLNYSFMDRQTPFAPYFRIGAAGVAPDKNIAKKSSYGGVVSFGFDLFAWRPSEKSPMAGMFVQSTWVEGLGKAIEIPSEPDVFNGITTTLGIRTYF